MLFEAYWKTQDRNTYHGFVKAESRDAAYKKLLEYLTGCYITAIYKANESQITPQSLTINFPNTSEYKLFG